MNRRALAFGLALFAIAVLGALSEVARGRMSFGAGVVYTAVPLLVGYGVGAWLRRRAQ